MTLSKPELEQLAQSLSMMIDAIEQGVTPEQVRARFAAAGISAQQTNTWVEIATELHDAANAGVGPPMATNPRYRKGTAMKPVAWSDCLWQPPA